MKPLIKIKLKGGRIVEIRDVSNTVTTTRSELADRFTQLMVANERTQRSDHQVAEFARNDSRSQFIVAR